MLPHFHTCGLQVSPSEFLPGEVTFRRVAGLSELGILQRGRMSKAEQRVRGEHSLCKTTAIQVYFWLRGSETRRLPIWVGLLI